MTPTTGSNPYADPKYIEHLKRKQQSINALCESLRQYLSVEVEVSLEYAESQASAGDDQDWLMEELNRASLQVEEMETSLIEVRHTANDPEAGPLGAMMGAQASMIDQVLSSRRGYRDSIQKRLEALARKEQA